MPPDSELIVVDDGSEPALTVPEWVCAVLRTNDRRPWTQPAARNYGAKHAPGDMLLFFDVDQILTRELLEKVVAFGSRANPFWEHSRHVLLWNRQPGCLGPSGLQYPADGKPLGPHPNTLAISRTAFDAVHGYREEFCGEYGYFDIDLTQRLAAAGFVSELASATGYYWTDKTIPPTHGLPRVDSKRNAALLGGKS